MDEDALRHEIEWQSELIDVMFPIVTSAYNLMEERAQDHTPDRPYAHAAWAISRRP
jgi:hypothetical protein